MNVKRKNVLIWLNDVKEAAIIIHWDDRKKFAFAKKMLIGSAQVEYGLSSWVKLRNLLNNSFKK